MIAANVRTRAVIGQEKAHALRSYHRERQKAAEHDDQTYQRIIRAIDSNHVTKANADAKLGKDLAGILAEASEDALAFLHAAEETPSLPAPSELDGEPAAVVAGTASDPALRSADGPAEARPTDDDRGTAGGDAAGAGAAGDGVPTDAVEAEAAPTERTVRRVPRFDPPPARTALEVCMERVEKYLSIEARDGLTTVEWPMLCKNCGSPKMVSAAIKALETARRITKVRGDGSAGLTFKLRGERAEAAE